MVEALKRERGQGERKCFLETYLSEGSFLDVVADFRYELTVERSRNNILSLISVVQCFLKSGSGTMKYIF